MFTSLSILTFKHSEEETFINKMSNQPPNAVITLPNRHLKLLLNERNYGPIFCHNFVMNYAKWQSRELVGVGALEIIFSFRK